MEKEVVVTFSDVGARILVNPDPEDYQSLPHLVNPDLSPFKGIPPHCLSLVDGKIVVVHEEEVARREEALAVPPAPPAPEEPKPVVVEQVKESLAQKLRPAVLPLLVITLNALISYLICLGMISQ